MLTFSGYLSYVWGLVMLTFKGLFSYVLGVSYAYLYGLVF